MKKENAVLLSVSSNTALIVFKLIAGILMGSVSVISEAVHSGIDLVASLIAFFAIRKAGKDHDEDHNYGYAKYENISGLIEAFLILAAGVMIIDKAVQKIITGVKIENLSVGILVMLSATLINLVVSKVLQYIGNRENSIAIKAEAQHLITDVYSSGGVMLGLVCIKLTGLTFLDSLFAIAVGGFIIKSAISLAIKSSGDLLDKSLDKEEIDQIKKVLDEHPAVLDYHKLRTRKSGEKREIDIHIQLDRDMRLEDVHLVCYCIENDIKKAFDECYIVLHPEPHEEGSNHL